MMRFSLIALGLFLVTSPGIASAAMTPEHEAEIKALVEKTLMEKPEIIINAFQAYQEKQQAEQQKAQEEALKNVLPELKKMTGLPVAGNPKGDVTIVEFYDYNCGYCKRVAPVTNEVVTEDGKVRWLFVDYPILAESSVTAAKASLAATKQNKHLGMHMALMAHQGALTDETVYEIAKKAGLDVERLKKDMADASINEQLQKNREIAEKLQIRGTPAFIIGDAIMPGAISADDMKRLIKQARGQ